MNNLESSLRAFVKTLSTSERNTGNCQEGLHRAADFVESGFREMGLVSTRQEFEADGVLCANIESVFPAYVCLTAQEHLCWFSKMIPQSRITSKADLPDRAQRRDPRCLTVCQGACFLCFARHTFEAGCLCIRIARWMFSRGVTHSKLQLRLSRWLPLMWSTWVRSAPPRATKACATRTWIHMCSLFS